MASEPCETEDKAKQIAALATSHGCKGVTIWERRYKAEQESTCVFTLPNGRREVFSPEPAPPAA